MAGRLLSAEPSTPKRAKRTFGDVVVLHVPHCEWCSDALGKAQCQRGQWSNLAIYVKVAKELPRSVMLVAEHREQGAVYSLQVLAEFDATVWQDPLLTAKNMYKHLTEGLA